MYFLGISLMTETGTFIVNGTERVIVSQLVRCQVRIMIAILTRRKKIIYLAKLIPTRGSWIEIETDKKMLLM